MDTTATSSSIATGCQDDVFLVMRDGSTWREIYRLTSDGVMTIGRDPGNRIVLFDDRCSRRHCAVYCEGEAWQVRDLGSRNGTLVNGSKVEEPTLIEDGATIVVGATELLFTTELSQPLDEVPPATTGPTRGLTRHASVLPAAAEPVIVDRKSQPSFVTESSLTGETGPGQTVREALSTLYRLVVGMMSAQTVKEVSETVLKGLVPSAGGDIGAVLLFPEQASDRTDPAELQIVSYSAPEQSPYRRVSTKLSTMVLEEGEALLARGIACDTQQGDFGSLRDIAATSVICAPIRGEDRVYGVLHIYALDADHQMDTDALELVLAVGDHLGTILGSLNQKESLTVSLRLAEDQNRSLSQLLEIESDLVGDSRPMCELRSSIGRVAVSDATVLIRGESGVGKELVARAVHFNSNRRDGPFVCVNCAALTETLLESELFGHEKGAFTGATDQKPGKFEQADEGTLFLDEVGEMPSAIQAKFLRVIEGYEFERVGGHAPVRVDVRIVAATNRDLESVVEQGDFRRDLLYRLQVIELNVPRLADHIEDAPMLAEYLLDRTCRRLGRAAMYFTPTAIERLSAYSWPGNVRELRSVVERAVVLHEGPEITPAELLFTPAVGVASPPLPQASETPVLLEDVEREHILRTLEAADGNKRETARILGINRSTLDRKLRKYEADVKELS